MKIERWPAPAKINLMLHVTGQRDDGYHELQTVFQFIEYCDELAFQLRADDHITRISEDFGVPEDEDIIVKAAFLLREQFRLRNPIDEKPMGVEISLLKRIPMGAGLGGGSSDAATTLVALNKLWHTGFSIEQLSDMGLKLGADVPVFVHGFAAFAEGVGEKLQEIILPESWYVVLVPPVHVSTKKVFTNPHLTRDCSAIKLCDLLQNEWQNVCTPVVVDDYPEVLQAIDIVGKYSRARMSGTGSSVFAAFDTEDQATDVLHKIRQNHEIDGWLSFIAKGMNRSPLHQLIEA